MPNRATILAATAAAALLLPAPLAACPGEPVEGRLAVTGGSLAYRSLGCGPPVVLLHGYLESSSAWEAHLATLATAHRVIAFDLPGHGRSDRLGPTFSHRGAAAALLEALTALEVPSFHLVGHSSGALIALRMALLQPERVLSLVGLAVPWRVPEGLREQAKRMSAETAPPPMLEVLRARHPGGREQIAWLFEQQRRMAADPGEMALTGEEIEGITAPSLIVHGDRDPLLPVAGAVELASRLPAGSLLVLPGAGHRLPAETGLAARLLAAAFSELPEAPTTPPAPRPRSSGG